MSVLLTSLLSISISSEDLPLPDICFSFVDDAEEKKIESVTYIHVYVFQYLFFKMAYTWKTFTSTREADTLCTIILIYVIRHECNYPRKRR